MFRKSANVRASPNAQARLDAAERIRLTLDAIGDAVISTDTAGRITYLNPVAEAMTGWTLAEALRRPLGEVLRIIDGDSRQPVRDPLSMAISRNAPAGLGAGSLLVGRDGHESAIEDTATPIHDRHGRVAGAVIVFRDVGAARAMSLRMSHLAHHDPLTGLPNRMLLADRLAQAVEAGRRHRKALALIFIDLDRFKPVNDAHGHGVGDDLLRSVASRLVAGVRGSDTVSRQGGDEFVVLLSEVAGPQDATSNAARLLAAIAAPHRIGGRDLRVTASAGVAVYPRDGQDAEALMEHADQALLRAKASGRAAPRLQQAC
jgi:diguanylate cyclase (GGDEF)-like protein/PAS domain S-box-containing protein